VQEGAGGGLVGRRGDGGLLRLVEEGAGPRGGLRHAGGGAGGGRRVRRGLLQHAAAALVAGVRVPGGVRTDGIKLNPVSTFRGELQYPRGTIPGQRALAWLPRAGPLLLGGW